MGADGSKQEEAEKPRKPKNKHLDKAAGGSTQRPRSDASNDRFTAREDDPQGRSSTPGGGGGGDGVKKCATCDGTGTVECERCNGTQKAKEDGVHGLVDCSACFATGRANCPSCAGTAIHWTLAPQARGMKAKPLKASKAFQD